MKKNRYLELLAKKKIWNDKTDLLDTKNQIKYKELCDELVLYQIRLEQQVYYNNRFDYINLIQKFVNGEINCYRFQWDFFEIYYHHIVIYENLKPEDATFDMNSNIENFESLVDELLTICEFLENGLSEKEFDQQLKKIYLKIQKYVELPLINYNDEQVLQFIMLVFSTLTILFYSFLNPSLFNLIWQEIKS